MTVRLPHEVTCYMKTRKVWSILCGYQCILIIMLIYAFHGKQLIIKLHTPLSMDVNIWHVGHAKNDAIETIFEDWTI